MWCEWRECGLDIMCGNVWMRHACSTFVGLFYRSFLHVKETYKRDVWMRHTWCLIHSLFIHITSHSHVSSTHDVFWDVMCKGIRVDETGVDETCEWDIVCRKRREVWMRHLFCRSLSHVKETYKRDPRMYEEMRGWDIMCRRTCEWDMKCKNTRVNEMQRM